MLLRSRSLFYFFFFNDTATTEIYTLSLHDALPICSRRRSSPCVPRPRSSRPCAARCRAPWPRSGSDRKSTRLNSSHLVISYAVFCLKKKKKKCESLHFLINTVANSVEHLGMRQGVR